LSVVSTFETKQGVLLRSGFGLDFIPNQGEKDEPEPRDQGGGHRGGEVTLRRTHRRFTAKEKRRIVKEDLRSDCKVAELCRREGISTAQYYTWSRLYDEFGLRGLEGEVRRSSTGTPKGSA